jgi:uncharacterized membrane protein
MRPLPTNCPPAGQIALFTRPEALYDLWAMSPRDEKPTVTGKRAGAQQTADRIHILREELACDPVRSVLALTPEQQHRFDEWSRATLASLAEQFDVDTSTSQKRVSWGMRIASTLGGLAICAALVLFFVHYWGYMSTAAQLAVVIPMPLALLAAVEFVFRRERTPYFTGLLALLALASFVMNLAVIGSIYNITSTERALLAWGAFAMVLAYRYGLRLMLSLGLLLLMSFCSAVYTAEMGYHWQAFLSRPEHFLLMGSVVFAVPAFCRHARNADFPRVYRLVGVLTFFIAILALAEWGVPSYLPWKPVNVERAYEIAGLLLSAGAIWSGIARNWNGVANTGSVFFAIFLFTCLFHWWWDWMPKYLFFAIIGVLGIVLVLAFKRLRERMIRREMGVAA